MESFLLLAGGGMLGLYVNNTTPAAGFWMGALNVLLLCGGVGAIALAGDYR